MAMSSLRYIPGFSVKFFFQQFLFLVTAAILNGGQGLSDTILKGTIPARFDSIWFIGFREDLNAIFYQNMPNLHNRLPSIQDGCCY
jgi:hypothetical protein